MRLLIVEDDRDIVKALTSLFEHNNYSVDAVYNGNDGYDYAAGGSYDSIVISTDQFMERIWGWDSDVEVSIVWVYISNLRKKFDKLDAPVSIKAGRGGKLL